MGVWQRECLISGTAIVFFFSLLPAQAGAGSFNVRAGYGVKVQEDGFCERLGPLEIKGVRPPGGGDVFEHGTELRIHLLGGARICREISASYIFTPPPAPDQPPTITYTADPPPTPPGPAEPMALFYTVTGELGADHYTITVNDQFFGPGGVVNTHLINLIRVNHDDYSPFCVNLYGTRYQAADPFYSLVQASFSDNQDNGYSGDRFLATVKDGPSGHTLRLCSKSKGTALLGEEWARQLNPKTGMPQIPLCYKQGAQEQNLGACGCLSGPEIVCVRITDTENAFQAGRQYAFRIGHCGDFKTGVGVASARLFHEDGIHHPQVTATERYDENCQLISGAIRCQEKMATKSYRIIATMQKSGTHYLTIGLAYDPCQAGIGDWEADIAGQRLYCGDAFLADDMDLARFTLCTDGLHTQKIFPYSGDMQNGWWTGLALTNPNGMEISIELDFYESDGDRFTALAAIPPKRLKVGLVNDPGFLSLTPRSADASFGDEPFWILGSAPVPFYGFLLIGDGAQAQGYLPIPYRMAE